MMPTNMGFYYPVAYDPRFAYNMINPSGSTNQTNPTSWSQSEKPSGKPNSSSSTSTKNSDNKS